MMVGDMNFVCSHDRGSDRTEKISRQTIKCLFHVIAPTFGARSLSACYIVRFASPFSTCLDAKPCFSTPLSASEKRENFSQIINKHLSLQLQVALDYLRVMNKTFSTTCRANILTNNFQFPQTEKKRSRSRLFATINLITFTSAKAFVD